LRVSPAPLDRGEFQPAAANAAEDFQTLHRRPRKTQEPPPWRGGPCDL